MGTLHISEAKLARDRYAVLAEVEDGVAWFNENLK